MSNTEKTLNEGITNAATPKIFKIVAVVGVTAASFLVGRVTKKAPKA